MKWIILKAIIGIVSFGFLCAQSCKKTDPVPPEGYRLEWSDEFNVDGAPDPEKWTFEEGFVRNYEIQWYQKENARCENGCLIIEAQVEHKECPSYDPASTNWRYSREFIEYTSSSLTTEGIRTFQDGIIEFRARIPVGQAAWPAIWTTGEQMPWPYNGEMDIMELYKVKNDGPALFANFFWTGKNEDDVRDNTVVTPITHFTANDPEWADKFHVWRAEWDEESIKISVDGELLNTGIISKMANGGEYEGTNPFLLPHILRVNLALRTKDYDQVDPDLLPYRMEVDYIRYFVKL